MSEAADRLEQALHLAEVARHMLATVDEAGTPRLTPVEECTYARGGPSCRSAGVD